jgi:hypothetical protein
VIQRRLELVFPAFARRLFAILPTWRWIRMPADRRLDRARRSQGGLRCDSRRAPASRTARSSGATALSSRYAAPRGGLIHSPTTDLRNLMTMRRGRRDTTAHASGAVHHARVTRRRARGAFAEADALRGGDASPTIETVNRLCTPARRQRGDAPRPVAPTHPRRSQP